MGAPPSIATFVAPLCGLNPQRVPNSFCKDVIVAQRKHGNALDRIYKFCGRADSDDDDGVDLGLALGLGLGLGGAAVIAAGIIYWKQRRVSVGSFFKIFNLIKLIDF